MYQRKLGKQGEYLVEEYLKRKGYQILERNFLKRSGEIDLIVEDNKRRETVFVEVKTRRTASFGRPEDAVNASKIFKMEKTAQRWLLENNRLNKPWRLDIIALELIDQPRITHFENVTL
ncbi:MAG: YraN family protein [Candidatus Peregrinibacteria bacterium]|nr:YraN family protein [Candidatus Peregrinibacteria bacterium]